MIYLLDANTLINAKNFYYPIKRVPEYWDWLVYQGQSGNIKIVTEIYDELKEKSSKDGEKDDLSIWAEMPEVKDALLFDEEADVDDVSTIIYEGYVANPTDNDVVNMGQDPFLISYGLRDIENRIIVTAEVSKPKRKGANRHVPDVCNHFGIRCMNGHQMIRELDFSTSWKK